jgi:crotonobetainyl-CoA:carnitine CoA-transferase CaiB-like acyl-CoA transferase
MNILLALRQRDLDGQARHLDIAMADNLFTLMYWGLGNGLAAQQWPKQGGELVTGGSARYQIYRTSDGQFLATAPIEDKFWYTFLTLIDLPELKNSGVMAPVRETIANKFKSQTLAHWLQVFEGHDVCVSEIKPLASSLDNPHFAARGVFNQTVSNTAGLTVTALPVPIDPAFRASASNLGTPALGENTQEILG